MSLLIYVRRHVDRLCVSLSVALQVTEWIEALQKQLQSLQSDIHHMYPTTPTHTRTRGTRTHAHAASSPQHTRNVFV